MIDGIEIFQLRQRRSSNGDTYFTGKLGTAAVVVVRDDLERDLWKVIVGDPFRTVNPAPTRPAIAEQPAIDDGDWSYDDNTGMNDDIPEQL